MSRPAFKREHGSMRGVRQHWRYHEKLCDECRPVYLEWRRVGDGYATIANGYWQRGENIGRPVGTGRPKNEPRCGKPMKVRAMKDGSSVDNPVCARPQYHKGACKSALAMQKQAERGKAWRKVNLPSRQEAESPSLTTANVAAVRKSSCSIIRLARSRVQSVTGAVRNDT